MKFCNPRLGALTLLCSLLVTYNLPGTAQSVSTQEMMHAQIKSLYSFSPSTVTAEVRTAKSKQMDAFWEEVRQNKTVELPLLRKELGNPANPPFFFFDGSTLLLSLSQEVDDQNLAAVAISRADLKDVQPRQYLYTVHGLSVKGIDITPAALHMLDDPKFEVFLPEHGAYKLDQSACLLVALLPLKSDIWLPAVIARSLHEPDRLAMKTLLLLLFYAQTDQADQLIRSMAAQGQSPSETQEFAKNILKHEHELGVGKKPSRQAEEKLREERRTRMHSVSDEAMGDMDELTGKIAQARTPTTHTP